jgi:hypothetical protein
MPVEFGDLRVSEEEVAADDKEDTDNGELDDDDD